MKKLLIVLALISCSAMAEDYNCSVMPCELIDTSKPVDYSWSGEQIVGEAVATSLMIVDFHQTSHFNYAKEYEENPLLGYYPSQRRIKNYFILSELVQLTTAQLFPSYRNLIIGFGIINEGRVVRGNRVKLGMEIKF